jgi:hypothetical protein
VSDASSDLKMTDYSLVAMQWLYFEEPAAPKPFVGERHRSASKRTYITEDLLEDRFRFAALLSTLLAMDDQDPSLQYWPNHRLKILIPTWTVLIISTLFVVWRVVYGLRNSRRFMLSDYLLIIATVSNIAN